MLTAVFVVGKLGEIVDDYRYVLVDKVPELEVEPENEADRFDKIKVKMWSKHPGILNRIKTGTMVSIKGRLEEDKGEMFVVIELFRTC